jgi:glutaminase
MLLNRFWVNVTIVCTIHGKKNNKAHATASILGINVIVISLMDVAAWNILTSKPTTKPANNIGAANEMAVLMASKKNPVINSGVILLRYILNSDQAIRNRSDVKRSPTFRFRIRVVARPLF